MKFSQFQEYALYHPRYGFFEHGGAGRDRDFITSPELGNVFGRTLAQALDRWWIDVGSPDEFVFVEAGAGSGALAKAIFNSKPMCQQALRYIAIEKSEVKRQQIAATIGSRVTIADDICHLDRDDVVGIVFANELLDNIPIDIYEFVADSWREIRIGIIDSQLSAVRTDIELSKSEQLRALLPNPPHGARIPLQTQAAQWVRDAATLLSRGKIVVIDYFSDTSEIASNRQSEWLRSYKKHAISEHVISRPGIADITCDVALDQIVAIAGSPNRNSSQAEFLEAHGIKEILADAHQAWQENRHRGDMVALRGLATINEVDALVDPVGLGSFRVLEWEI